MNDSSQHELLSAYLDGELTADEQTQVERLLADDPRARRLLDELRALSATLQSLPQHKLGENITEQVLRMAERRKRSAEAELPRPAEPSQPPLPARWRRMLSGRTLVWTGLTVAVAVVIVLNEPRRPQPGKDVAVAPPAEHDEEIARGLKPGPAPEMRSAGELTEVQKDLAEANVAASRKREMSRASGEKASRPKHAEFYADGKKIVLPEEETVDGRTKDLGGVATADPMSRTKGVAAGPDSLPTLAGKMGAKGGGLGGGTAAGAAPEGPENRERAQADANSLVVIVCDVSPEAAKNQTFRQTLADNQIVWSDDTPPADETATTDAEDVADKDRATRAENNRVASNTLRLTEGLFKAGAAELVEVRATPAQIDATLDRLASLPEQFFNVSVDAGANVDARGRWASGGRRGGAVRKANDPALKLADEKVPPAKGEAVRDDVSTEDRVKEQEKPQREVARYDKIAQYGIAHPITRLDAWDEADLQSRLAPSDRYEARLEMKPAEALSGGGLFLPGSGISGGVAKPGLGAAVPAGQPAPTDIAHRTPVLPAAPSVPAAATEAIAPDLAKKPATTATAALPAENAPKADRSGVINGVANGEQPRQPGGGKGGGEGLSLPKAEAPAPPAIVSAPTKPGAETPATETPAGLTYGRGPAAGQGAPARPSARPSTGKPSDSRPAEGKAEKAEESWAVEGVKNANGSGMGDAPTLRDAEKDAPGDGSEREKLAELAKQRNLAEKKKSGDAKKEPAPGKDAVKESEGEGRRLGQALGSERAEKRDGTAEPRRDANPPQSAPGNTWRYAESQKSLEEQRPSEPTCRVLFVLRVVPTYAAKAKIETKAAAAMEKAASKIEADAAREAPAAKSK
jgi:hypothetical protein